MAYLSDRKVKRARTTAPKTARLISTVHPSIIKIDKPKAFSGFFEKINDLRMIPYP
jgi:hypothetical protein